MDTDNKAHVEKLLQEFQELEKTLSQEQKTALTKKLTDIMRELNDDIERAR